MNAYIAIYRNYQNGARRRASITASSTKEAWFKAGQLKSPSEIVETVY